MSKLVLNRDGGSADEYGHLLALNRLLVGDVIQGMNITQDTGSNLAVRVQPGTARISTGTGATAYGYFVAVDTSGGEQVTIGTANASNPRIDLIVAYVYKGVTPATSTANNPNNMLKLVAVQGTPAATAQDPTQASIQSAVGAANPYIVLGRVYVDTATTSILNAKITDLRSLALPNTTLGYSEAVAGSTQNFTTTADVAGCSVTFKLATARRVEVVAWILATNNPTPSVHRYQIQEGSTILRLTQNYIATTTSYGQLFSWSGVLPAGEHTLKVTAAANGGGTGTIDNNSGGSSYLHVKAA